MSLKLILCLMCMVQIIAAQDNSPQNVHPCLVATFNCFMTNHVNPKFDTEENAAQTCDKKDVLEQCVETQTDCSQNQKSGFKKMIDFGCTQKTKEASFKTHQCAENKRDELMACMTNIQDEDKCQAVTNVLKCTKEFFFKYKEECGIGAKKATKIYKNFLFFASDLNEASCVIED